MINYKIKSKTATVGKSKGEKVYYAAPVTTSRYTTKQVEDSIVQATALSRADVRSAITALAEVMKEALLSGAIVDLADLGTFKVVSNGRYMPTEKEVTVASLKTPVIRFFPKDEMKQKAKQVKRNIMRNPEE